MKKEKEILKFEKKLIEVCSECSMACCWHGEFMCPENKTAGTELKTVSYLRTLNIENSDNWSDEKLKAVYGESAPHGYQGIGLEIVKDLKTCKKPTWQDQPTEDGYYLVADPDFKNKQIIFVDTQMGVDEYVKVAYKFNKNNSLVSLITGKWYGPINPPKED